MLEMVKTPSGLIENVREYQRAVKDPRIPTRPSGVQGWYYIPTLDMVGASRFIGYEGMTAERYVERDEVDDRGREIDGRVTEPYLQRTGWFRQLTEGEPLYVRAKSLAEALSPTGKLSPTARFYVLNVGLGARVEEAREKPPPIPKTGKPLAKEFVEEKPPPPYFPAELLSFYSSPTFLGKGGFARVFQTRRKKDGEEVALKIPIDLDPSTGKSFLREMENWQKLEHENILRLLDFNILPVPFLETEFCERSLEDLKKPINIERAVLLIFEVTRGLKYAHNKGIIHRDLKPSNILFKGEVPKIADWGLSKMKGGSRSLSVQAFSPLYATPEQISPVTFGGTDEWTDIFQLGVIFYELITGRLPFEGEDYYQISLAIQNETPEPPSRLNPEAKEIEPLIMKCLAKRKEERFQSIGEFRRELADFLKREYGRSLKVSRDSKDFKKSTEHCAELAQLHAETNDFPTALTYVVELQNYAPEEHYRRLAGLIAHSFEVILDINKNCCDRKNPPQMREINRRYEMLKECLGDDALIKEIEEDEYLGQAIMRMNAVMNENEWLQIEQIERIEYFGEKFARKALSWVIAP